MDLHVLTIIGPVLVLINIVFMGVYVIMEPGVSRTRFALSVAPALILLDALYLVIGRLTE